MIQLHHLHHLYHFNMNHQPPTESLMDHLLPSSLVFSPAPPPPLQPPTSAKRKRSLPGNPDPDSEVIALSPNSLLATNRFMCEICNKGFQRDQNLQLHRRGHNLPWKLKQRAKDEVVKKKVYICPEPGCVHHDPARALGDLTGIKKHFYRKHGEKKWKCDKCSKKYAVQSDWKAHSKTCGTKEYKCECGTLFSRRDSFITHKAFCDALVEDSARAITSNPFLPPPPQQQHQQQQQDLQATTHHEHHQSAAATASQNTNMMFILQNQDQSQLPPWLQSSSPPPSLFFNHDQMLMQQPSQNPSHVIGGPTLYPPLPAHPHMSATALLQKAAQLGAIMSTKLPISLPSSTSSSSSLLLHEMMLMKSMPNPFDGDMINAFGNGGISDGLTRDFLGVSPLIQAHPAAADHNVNLTMAGLAEPNAEELV